MTAWAKLTDKHDERKVWEKFHARFSFSPQGKGPVIKDPTPSVTYDLAPLAERGFPDLASHPLVDEFHAVASRCLRRSIPAGQFFYVLYWSSTTYTFDPHAEDFNPRNILEWEVPLLPVKGKYAQAPFECYAFWHPAFALGIFINPCAEMTVFGRTLLDEFARQRLDPLFNKVKRRDGVPVS